MDPVVFQVIESRLSGIVAEMQESIFRTGYSTIIRETQDASCLILDVHGDVVGEQVILPLHITALPAVVRAIRSAYGDDIHEGDVFITNHPYECGVTHSSDMAVVAPVYYQGRLIAFCGSIAHKSDLGGMVPGSGSGNARELFQEAVLYPALRYVARGEIVRDVDTLLRANSRTPELVAGDLRGQIGVTRLGEERLRQTAHKYGVETLLEAFAYKQDLTERRVRAELVSWPDGRAEAETFVDNDGIVLDRRIRYHVAIEKRGDRIRFDFTGCDDQAQGPVNISPSLARGCCYFALIATMDSTLPNNAGLARAVETAFRHGSVIDPVFPAPCNTYMASTTAITEAALRALSTFVPSRRMGGNGGVGNVVTSGARPQGGAFVLYESVASAYGGRAGTDGSSGVSVLLSNTLSSSVEVLECEFPVRYERYALIPDSGGAGEFRGGLSPRREWRILADDAQLTLRGGRHEAPAYGEERGNGGRLGACVVNPESNDARSLPSRFSGVRLKRDDIVRLEKAGGGGYGDPHRRAFERILEDVLDGLVTRAAAIADYGVDADRLDRALTLFEKQEGVLSSSTPS
jgi:N-methylhydantoinase B